MESEVDLDEAVKRLLAVAGSPELFPQFANTNAISCLLSLLAYQNTDIASGVLELLKELTEEDVMEDSVRVMLNSSSLCTAQFRTLDLGSKPSNQNPTPLIKFETTYPCPCTLSSGAVTCCTGGGGGCAIERHAGQECVGAAGSAAGPTRRLGA